MANYTRRKLSLVSVDLLGGHEKLFDLVRALTERGRNPDRVSGIWTTSDVIRFALGEAYEKYLPTKEKGKKRE